MVKKALLIGINYRGTESELSGCINDVQNMSIILQNNYNFTKIKMLTDDTIDKPRKSSIIRNLEWLLGNNKKGDELYFHYSGHGSWMYDQNNDEDDCKDECLIPIDYNSHGVILDDLLQEIIVKKLNRGVKLTVILDCCHSGTALDLRYSCNFNTNFIKVENMGYMLIPNVFMISGCRDDQTSADAYIEKKYQGALSYHVMKVLKEHNFNITKGDLLKELHKYLKTGGYTQKPVISSGTEINLLENFQL